MAFKVTGIKIGSKLTAQDGLAPTLQNSRISQLQNGLSGIPVELTRFHPTRPTQLWALCTELARGDVTSLQDQLQLHIVLISRKKTSDRAHAPVSLPTRQKIVVLSDSQRPQTNTDA